jgi:hypothetical protein
MQSRSGRRSHRAGLFAALIVVALSSPSPGVAEPVSAGTTETASLMPDPYAPTLRARRPEQAWMTARSELLRGRAYSEDDERKRSAIEYARDTARRARVEAPSCAECCLYEFAATAQLATLGPPSESLYNAREAGRILEMCLAEPPPQAVDDDGISEQAKLYFGASQYYRRLPQSALLGWMFGLNGDTERAVLLARDAVALEPDHPPYRVELAAALLCHADQRGNAVGDEPWVLLEGLRDAAEDEVRLGAADLVAEPDAACAFGARFPGMD